MINKYDRELDMNTGSSYSILLNQIKPCSTVLEFGCATGYMTQYMKEELACDVSIVELEPESYEVAIEYAVHGFLGDAMSLDWLQEFHGISFDYILFADILEHLTEPQKVLMNANKLLKEEGKILISVPNICHVGILAELYANRFHYRPTGLLDNTHIHFFSYESFCEMIDHCDNVVEIYNGTFLALENSEFYAYEKKLPCEILSYLKNKELSSVYQFIFTLVKKSFAKENSEFRVQSFLDVKNTYEAMLYWDYGFGLSEGHKEIISQDVHSSKLLAMTDIPKGVEHIRFDPTEGYFSLLKNVEIYIDYEKYIDFTCNGDVVGNYILFSTHDPQIFITNIKGKKKLKIVGELENISEIFSEIFLEYKKQGEYVQKELSESITLLQENCDSYVQQLTENTNILEEKNQVLSSKEDEIHAKDTLLHEQEDELHAKDTLMYEKEEAIQEKDILLHEKEEAIQEKDILLHEKEEAIQEKDALLYEKEEAIQEKDALLQEKEESLQAKDTLLHEKEEAIQEKNLILSEKEQNLQKTFGELSHYQEHYHAAMGQRGELAQQLHQRDVELMQLRLSYEDMSNSFFWKMTKPCRKFLDFLKRNKGINLTIKGVKSLKNDGLKDTWHKIRKKLSVKYRTRNYKPEVMISQQERIEQENFVFSKNIKISIVVPLFNTPESFLVEMIDSVRQQTYGNWELCMADGSDGKYKYVEKICNELSQGNTRIRYKKLKKNLGISENTNACIEMSSGEYIGLLDHDDLLHPSALFYVMKEICDRGAEFIYTDEDKTDETGLRFFDPHFKSDFSPDLLRSQNYICHFSVFKKSFLSEIGYFNSEYNGCQDHDLVLRITEKTNKIYHIPKVLYHWRVHKNSVASTSFAKSYTQDVGIKVVQSHIDRIGLSGVVYKGRFENTYRIKYQLNSQPKISILIPNKDHKEDLQRCINSIYHLSTYKNIEIIVIENNSVTLEIFEYYKELSVYDNLEVVYYDDDFNYSKINNFGAQYATGEYIVLLNNDVEIITPEWLEEMLMLCQRSDVGIVGAKLYYPDKTIQHAGVIIGLGGIAGHSHKHEVNNAVGYFGRLNIVQNYSAVTAACLMVKKDVLDVMHGLDESFKVAFNDVDFCLRVLSAHYLICWTPYAEAYHYESKSRGAEDTKEKQKRFQNEIDLFKERWMGFLEMRDPYYNKNLTLDREDFTIDDNY